MAAASTDGRLSGVTFWSPPRLWDGETVVLLGGGPSLADLDLSPLESAPVRVVAINNAWEIAPRCDLLFFGDARWWRWNRDKLAFEAPFRIATACSGELADGRVLRLKRAYARPYAYERDSVFGADSGHMAMNLVRHLGVRRIVLAGFDMRFAPGGASHWHGDHQIESRERYYRDLFAPNYPASVNALAAEGIEVVRCTPSALDFIASVSLASVL